MLSKTKRFYWELLGKTRASRFDAIFDRLECFTMLPRETYIANLRLVERFSDVPGVVVECGVWKGGMIAGIRMILGDKRQYVLFDSFEGLPAAKEIDGDAALDWQANTKSEHYYDNCTAAEEDAVKAMVLSGATNYKIVKGWFSKTLSSFTFDEGIAVLRLDGDWYESTMVCLQTLFPHVNDGGVIIVDDYYTWEGCSKAVHDYLSTRRRPERVHQFWETVCFLIKK